MRLLSVNVGLPRRAVWRGEPVLTGIFKEPVAGRIMLRTLNLDGDRQADLTVHGGASKAVYVYPFEHYAHWRTELPGREFPFGSFGENFTVEGISEDAVNIGDRFRVGAAEVVVTEPRLPCYKLNIKFGRADMVKRFAASQRTGFYFAVLREGDVGAGDPFELSSRDGGSVTVADIVRLYLSDKRNTVLMRRALQVEALPPSWRNYFAEQLAKSEARPAL